MNEWIPVENRLPMGAMEGVNFESFPYLVTDGQTVGITDFGRGHGCGKPWASWSMYGDISPAKITHWMPLPGLPK